MPRTAAHMLNAVHAHLGPEGVETFKRLYKPQDTSEGVVTHPPLFATGEELAKSTVHVDMAAYQNQNKTTSDLLDEKYKSASVQAKFEKRLGASPEAVEKRTGMSEVGGSGTGEGVKRGIEKRGYDWSKPVPIGMQGAENDGGAFEADGVPMMANAGHRVAVMRKDRPDEFIPLEHYAKHAPIFKHSPQTPLAPPA